MSLARIYRTKKVRKDWVCDKCKQPIKKGVDGRISFTVGFRGFERTRCTRPACHPKPSERESSLVSAVYAAQEENDPNTADNYDDLIATRDAVVEACREVAQEYESGEMFEVNSELQERRDQLEQAADDLEGWEPESEEPQEDSWRPDSEYDDFDDAHQAWLDEARGSLETAINELDLP